LIKFLFSDSSNYSEYNYNKETHNKFLNHEKYSNNFNSKGSFISDKIHLNCFPEKYMINISSEESNNKIQEKKTLNISSKFMSHTNNISHIIQLKPKIPEKNKFKQKYKIITSSWDSTIKIWDFDSTNCIATLNGHLGAVYCIRQIRDYLKEKELKVKNEYKSHKRYTKLLASCGIDHTIRIWDLKKFRIVKIFQGHNNIVEQIIQIKAKLFSCSHDKLIKIWNFSIDEKKDFKEFNQILSKDLNLDHNIKYKKTTFLDLDDKDLDFINSNVSKEKLCKKMNLKENLDKYLISNFEGDLKGHSDIIKVLNRINIKKNKYLLSGGHDSIIKVWDVKNKYLIKDLKGHGHCVNTIIKLKWKYDDVTIASGSLDKTIKLWNLIDFNCFFSFKAHEDNINRLIYLRWGNHEDILISCGDDKSIKIWDLEFDKKENESFKATLLKKICNYGDAHYVSTIKQMKWNRNETTLISGGNDNKITIWS
jgi:WD40 repeat protein